MCGFFGTQILEELKLDLKSKQQRDIDIRTSVMNMAKYAPLILQVLTSMDCHLILLNGFQAGALEKQPSTCFRCKSTSNINACRGNV